MIAIRLSFWSSMDRITSHVRADTNVDADAGPACPAESFNKAGVVVAAMGPAIDAAEDSEPSAAAIVAAGSTTPRRGEPRRSFSRAGRGGCALSPPGSAAAGPPHRGRAPRSSRAPREAGTPWVAGRSRRGGPGRARGRSPIPRPAGTVNRAGRLRRSSPARSRPDPRWCADQAAVPGPCAPCGRRRHRARQPAGRVRGPTVALARARGRRPGRRPRHGAGRPEFAGRPAGPSAHAGPPRRQTPLARRHRRGR